MAFETVDDRSFLAGDYGGWFQQYAESVKALPPATRAAIREDVEEALEAAADQQEIGAAHRVLQILDEIEAHRSAMRFIARIGRPGAAR